MDTSATTTITYSQILKGLEWTADDYRSLMGLTGAADAHKTTADNHRTTADSDRALTDLYDYYWELL